MTDLINVDDVPYSIVVDKVQHRLAELGYVVGELDGKVGRKTQANILDFRNRNGLPLKPTIDDEFLAALETADKIELPIAQVTADAPTIAPKVEAVKLTRLGKIKAKIAAWGSFVSALALAASQHFGDAVGYITPIKSLAEQVPAWVWVGAAGGIATLIALNMSKAESAMVEGYNKGTIANDAPKSEEGP